MSSTLENLFTFIDQQTQDLSKKENIPYLEAVLEVLELWLDGENVPSGNSFLKEDVRKSIQLAILKGMKAHVQPHHHMTPDSLGLLVAYFVEKFTSNKDHFTVLDPAIGTGNLLYTVMNYVQKNVTAEGVEIDDMLIQLAAATGDLLQHEVQLHRQDALQPLLIDPVDVVVSDLPAGYYPNEKIGSTYFLGNKEGMSFAHHLFIEQSVKHIKDGGHLLLFVPQNLFESEEASRLHEFFQQHVWIEAVIQLPDNLFKQSNFAKSLLVLQKKSSESKKPREVLLAKVPSMSNKEAMSLFFQKVDIWMEQNERA
ncbi:class I SAM-dependent methyltransferase [Paenisporosarcina cavernae]|uniref:Class I SAM-dependent methyltransferase n=1 Tax=Paenisporosarcina cavernae TaxID=2320858 RepID=A0A385YX09_9BACL|nr:class I SAM-dependent methyltransferase [Paenisporosarcina cavernae]AYC30800.1 class I SAM-dependent methyltransferase [Paenisporosarcina cavernae]